MLRRLVREHRLWRARDRPRTSTSSSTRHPKRSGGSSPPSIPTGSTSSRPPQRALAERDQFNLIDLTTTWKVDLIIRKDRPFSLSEFDRRVRSTILGVDVYQATAEDTVLAKLEWAAIERIRPPGRRPARPGPGVSRRAASAHRRPRRLGRSALSSNPMGSPFASTVVTTNRPRSPGWTTVSCDPASAVNRSSPAPRLLDPVGAAMHSHVSRRTSCESAWCPRPSCRRCPLESVGEDGPSGSGEEPPRTVVVAVSGTGCRGQGRVRRRSCWVAGDGSRPRSARAVGQRSSWRWAAERSPRARAAATSTRVGVLGPRVDGEGPAGEASARSTSPPADQQLARPDRGADEAGAVVLPVEVDPVGVGDVDVEVAPVQVDRGRGGA